MAKIERFCSNCKYYQPIDKGAKQLVCQHPVKFFKGMYKPDGYCPYHEYGQKK